MAKNQIIITLKPEQLEEIQRLAETAGAKSAALFARQQLLAHLKLDDATASSPSLNPTPNYAASASIEAKLPHNMSALTANLQRIHNELKQFVAESQASIYNVSGANAGEGSIPAAIPIPAPAPAAAPTSAPEQTVLPNSASEIAPQAATISSANEVIPFDSIPENQHLPTLEEVLQSFEEASMYLNEFEKHIIPPSLSELQTPGNIEDLQKLPADDKDPLEDILDHPLIRHLDEIVTKSVAAGDIDAAVMTAHNSDLANMLETLSDTTIKPPPPIPLPSLPPDFSSGPRLSGGPPPKKRQ